MKIIIVTLLKFFYRIPLVSTRKRLISVIGKIEGGQAFSKTIRLLMEKYHGLKIGIGTYGPCFNLDQTWAGFGNLEIGNYTSIAKGVCIYTRNHPYEKPSTSPIFYNASMSKRRLNKDSVAYGKLKIGNDVWIGQYAVILPSVRYIGDGAVVGAGCIVTKDVPDYAIVVGNPGKIIKYRFDEKTINRIKKTKWWEYEPEKLLDKVGCFNSLEAFFDRFG